MVFDGKTSLLIRICNVFCLFLLILAVLCEAYTVLAIALDRFVPAWYRTLGWLLLIIPGALALGLFLIYANRRRLAFCLSATSLSMYAMLNFLDAYQGHAERGDWIFEAGWLVFCAICIVAARYLSRPISESY
jgi:hypothetical protein